MWRVEDAVKLRERGLDDGQRKNKGTETASPSANCQSPVASLRLPMAATGKRQLKSGNYRIRFPFSMPHGNSDT
jgi:hypothetical protein